MGGLATSLVAGDASVVEVLPVDRVNEVQLTLDQVVHAYRDVVGKASSSRRRSEWSAVRTAIPGDCNINVNCPEGATWQCEKRSVALILLVDSRCVRVHW